MSFVIAAPEIVTSAASDLVDIGSRISQANAAAASSTTGCGRGRWDEVSAAIASLFSSHARHYQALSAQAAAFHAQFVQALYRGRARMRPPRRPTLRRCRTCSRTRAWRCFRPSRT